MHELILPVYAPVAPLYTTRALRGGDTVYAALSTCVYMLLGEIGEKYFSFS
jgi:hypothetical protein